MNETKRFVDTDAGTRVAADTLIPVGIAAAVGVAHAGLYRLRTASAYPPSMTSLRDRAMLDAAKLFEEAARLLKGDVVC